MQETLVHKLWLLVHALLLLLHIGVHTLLNKALPAVFAEPSMTRMLKGDLPYRAVIQSMYRDGLVLAGFLAAAVAGVMQLAISRNSIQSFVAT